MKKLYLTKIFEGGVNLETGEHIPYGLLISNGEYEVGIPVDEESVNRISMLICDTVPEVSKDLVSKTANDPVISSNKGVLKNGESYKEPAKLAVVPGPGSSYDDELTGVSSL